LNLSVVSTNIFFAVSHHHLEMLFLPHMLEDHSEGITTHVGIRAIIHIMHIIIDAVLRLIPGVLGDAASAAEDSFHHKLLDHPHYTRPENTAKIRAPEILLSGNHALIARWRLKQALGRTFLHRPDILNQLELSDAQQKLLNEFLTEQHLGEPS